MSIPNLPVDFKDDILASSNTKRKYRQTTNDDSTVSFEDVTNYSQEGSEFGAKEVNQTNTAINNIYDERVLDVDALELITEPGFFVDAQAVKELNGKTSQFFSASEANSIEITAPYDCAVEVTHTFLGWGYAGNLLVFGINSSSSGITKKCENFGGCQGGDMVNKYLRADAIFSGLKKGEKYTFSRQDISGASGAYNNRKWTVICHPE